jgi:predicted lipid-binding transport protein (Tim44 family)
MRPVALACLGLLGLAAAALPQAPSRAQAPATPPTATAPAAPAASTPAPPHAETTQAAPAKADGKGDGRGAGRAKRRISYAACNRAAQRRNLKGGARRRFLIRCRLGYERIQPGQPGRNRP